MQSDVLLAMVMCSLFLNEIPMGYKEKVILCVLIMKYMDMYIKTEADLIWVNNQIKKMESESSKDDNRAEVAIRGTGTFERDWASDE
jgi:hypothetical protein